MCACMCIGMMHLQGECICVCVFAHNTYMHIRVHAVAYMSMCVLCAVCKSKFVVNMFVMYAYSCVFMFM